MNGDGNLHSYIVNELEKEDGPQYLTDLYLTPKDDRVHVVVLDSGN